MNLAIGLIQLHQGSFESGSGNTQNTATTKASDVESGPWNNQNTSTTKSSSVENGHWIDSSTAW